MKTITTTNGQCSLILNYGKNTLPLPKIAYIVGDGNYSIISTTEGKGILSSFTLRVFFNELNNHENFFSPRKGLLLNLSFLKEIVEDNGLLFAKMKDNNTHLLSRRKGKKLLDYLKVNNWNVKGV